VGSSAALLAGTTEPGGTESTRAETADGGWTGERRPTTIGGRRQAEAADLFDSRPIRTETGRRQGPRGGDGYKPARRRAGQRRSTAAGKEKTDGGHENVGCGGRRNPTRSDTMLDEEQHPLTGGQRPHI
jgi:hypothetical protein